MQITRGTKEARFYSSYINRFLQPDSIIPNQASCLRLVSAILCEISEEWLTGRTYITLDPST